MRYDITYADILKEFSLKHIISFYELIEEQVANSIIDKIDEKFKTPLTQQMKDSIKNIIDYDDSENQNQQRIPAKAFAFALKRFIYRFLLVDFNIENLNLNTYFLDFTLNLWSDVNEESVEKLFPTCLLVSHAYNSYNFIVEEIEKTMNERQNSRRAYESYKRDNTRFGKIMLRWEDGCGKRKKMIRRKRELEVKEKERIIAEITSNNDNTNQKSFLSGNFGIIVSGCFIRWYKGKSMVKERRERDKWQLWKKSQKDLEDTLSNAAEKGDGTKWTFCTFREVKDQVDQRAERTEDRRYSNNKNENYHLDQWARIMFKVVMSGAWKRR
ncbi:hypothetical protein RhiirC2_870063 [Rhizophagus irregularis]|uniref:Uncharacterized protein n=1 Tax=Rhizophagus irregularis TaxID=588596 RepID=A0A2N1MM45_9GLOM|nr:hypothetical protein RhiirC2_870063 [Rhizophagus irregularis]